MKSIPRAYPMSRRTFLRGVGAAVALPLLDAMLPSLSSVVSAARELFGNPNPFSNGSLPGRYPILFSLGWSALILIVFVPLAVRKYRSATSR